LIVPLVTQTKGEAMRELRSLSSDQKWLAKTVASLAE